MKKHLLILITLLSLSLLSAQNHPDKPTLTNEQFFSQAELVIEGQFAKIVDTYDTKGTGKFEDCIAVDAIRVKKVYKGDTALTGKLIYLTRLGTRLGEESWYEEARISDDGIYISYDIGISYTTPKIFFENGIDFGVSSRTPKIYFLKSSDLPDDSNSKYFSYNKYTNLEKYCNYSSGFYNFMYVCDDINVIAGLDNLIFRNRRDFYDYMKQFEGYIVPELTNLYEKQLDKKELNNVVLDSVRYQAVVDSIINEMSKVKFEVEKRKEKKIGK